MNQQQGRNGQQRGQQPRQPSFSLHLVNIEQPQGAAANARNMVVQILEGASPPQQLMRVRFDMNNLPQGASSTNTQGEASFIFNNIPANAQQVLLSAIAIALGSPRVDATIDMSQGQAHPTQPAHTTPIADYMELHADKGTMQANGNIRYQISVTVTDRQHKPYNGKVRFKWLGQSQEVALKKGSFLFVVDFNQKDCILHVDVLGSDLDKEISLNGPKPQPQQPPQRPTGRGIRDWFMYGFRGGNL